MRRWSGLSPPVHTSEVFFILESTSGAAAASFAFDHVSILFSLVVKKVVVVEATESSANSKHKNM